MADAYPLTYTCVDTGKNLCTYLSMVDIEGRRNHHAWYPDSICVALLCIINHQY